MKIQVLKKNVSSLGAKIQILLNATFVLDDMRLF